MDVSNFRGVCPLCSESFEKMDSIIAHVKNCVAKQGSESFKPIVHKSFSLQETKSTDCEYGSYDQGENLLKTQDETKAQVIRGGVDDEKVLVVSELKELVYVNKQFRPKQNTVSHLAGTSEQAELELPPVKALGVCSIAPPAAGNNVPPIIAQDRLKHLPSTRVLSDVYKMLSDSSTCDAVLFGREKIPIMCHRFMLQARCPALLSNTFFKATESRIQTIIPLVNYTHAALDLFIKYVYTGRVVADNEELKEEVKSIAKIADMATSDAEIQDRRALPPDEAKNVCATLQQCDSLNDMESDFKSPSGPGREDGSKLFLVPSDDSSVFPDTQLANMIEKAKKRKNDDIFHLSSQQKRGKLSQISKLDNAFLSRDPIPEQGSENVSWSNDEIFESVSSGLVANDPAVPLNSDPFDDDDIFNEIVDKVLGEQENQKRN